MTSPVNPTQDLLKNWLEQAHIAYYLCDQCDGLHVKALQELPGVVDSRLLLQDYGVLLTTELEIRPMAVLPLAADLGRLNMDFPILKLFIDVVDDATPQLVVAAHLHSGAGLTPAQLGWFAEQTMAATSQLATECLQLDYLYQEPGEATSTPSRALH